MSNVFELIAETRNDMGKGASRRLRRRADKVPAIIYGGESSPLPLMVDHNHLLKALENEAFYSHILTVKVDGKPEKAVLKALQRHPSKPRIIHMDLLRITGKEKIYMRVPLHFLGEEKAPGVKEGGIVSHLLSDIEVHCLPDNLPEYIEVDVANLALGESIHLSHLTLPKGVELVELNHGHDLPVASIHLPRAAIAEEVAAAVEEVPAAEVPATEEGKEQPAE